MTVKRAFGQVAIKSAEELGFMLDTFHVPMLEKQQMRLVYGSFRVANTIAKAIGEKPKTYKRIVKRGTIEVILP
jgi:hypothetical protein